VRRLQAGESTLAGQRALASSIDTLKINMQVYFQHSEAFDMLLDTQECQKQAKEG
jgi:hypothetical protein